MKTIAFAASIVTAITFNVAAWLGGFNFDRRGADAFTLFAVTIISSTFVWAMVYDITRKR